MKKNLLSGELRQSSSLNGSVGLDHLGCAEGLVIVTMVIILIMLIRMPMF